MDQKKSLEDETLKEMLELAKSILDLYDNGSQPDEWDVTCLAQAVEALDDWLVKGGSLPTRWKVKKG